MEPQSWKTLCTALLAAVVLLAGPVHAERASPSADLATDPRLQKPVTLEADALDMQLVVRTVHRLTGVPLMVQGDLLRRSVAVRVKDPSCAKLLERLAELFGGEWVARDGGYLLVTEEVRAGIPRAERDPEVGWKAIALFESLTPGEWARLRVSKVVRFQDLVPDHQRLVLLIVRSEYGWHPERFPSSVLIGQGCGILASIAQSDTGGDGVFMEVFVPTVSDDGFVLPQQVFATSLNGPEAEKALANLRGRR